MAPVTLCLLGGFQARLGAGEQLSLPTKKAQALLAYLALTPGQAHARDKLAALLWGDAGAEQARHSLRQALNVLRKALPANEPTPLVTTGETLALDPAAVEVDVATFERQVREGTPAALEQAAALYQGDLLAGLGRMEAPFEEWLLGERERVRELALEALAKLLRHQTAAGLLEPATQTALRLLALDPWQEAVHRALMRLYAQQGRRGMALKQYQLCLNVLQRDLGVEPEPETKRLYQEILRRRVAEPGPAEARPAHPTSRPRPEPAGAPAPAREISLVGRERELARLRDALAEAEQGRGQVVVMLGEAGIGKTRLVEELAAEAQERGARVLLGRAYESEQILPFGPWVDALRSGKALAETDVLEALGPVWRAELVRLFPELAPPGAPPAPGAEDYRRLFEAVAELVRLLASHQPLLLVLEDVHWADEITLRLLAFLARRVQGGPALLVATVREEEVAGATVLQQIVEELTREPQCRQLPLAPLARAETAALVRALGRTGSDEASLAQLAEQAWAMSEGNPFVVVETMRALQEGTAPRTPTALSLPERVQRLIAGRLQRLSDRAQQLAGVAAVVGREFEFSLLARCAELDERVVAEGVEELIRRRVLHGVEERFAFSHDRIREVAYGRLLEPRRKLLHGAVARAMETVYAEQRGPRPADLGVDRLHRASESLELVASHFDRAGIWDKAVHYYLRAAEDSKARYAYETAIRFCERAVEVAARAPELARDQVRGLVLLGDLWSLMGNLEGANQAYQQALEASTDGTVRRRITEKRHRPHTVVRGGARIAFYEHGSGDHTLVFANPLLFGLATFQPLIENLCEEFRIITIDSRGTGASDPLVLPYSIKDHAEDVRAVIEGSGTAPVVGVGISRGCNAFVKLAVAYPGLLEKLVLIGTPLPGIFRPPAAAVELLRRGDLERGVQSFFSVILSEPGLEILVDQFARNCLRLPRESILGFFESDPEMDIRPLLPKVQVPTLLTHGTADRLVPIESTQYLLSNIPGASLYLFEGRAHLSVFTATSEFCRVLRSFVRTGPLPNPEAAGS